MKFTYAFLLVISLFAMILLNVISFATSPDEATAHALATHRESWDLTVEEGALRGQSAAQAKADLIKFIQQTPFRRSASAQQFSQLCALAAVFSAIGLVTHILSHRTPRP